MATSLLRVRNCLRTPVVGRVAQLPQRTYLHSLAPNPLPASFLRGGTSKGIFINRDVLPEDRVHWDPIFLGIMGSPDPEYGRQLNGMGGGGAEGVKGVCAGETTSEAFLT